MTEARPPRLLIVTLVPEGGVGALAEVATRWLRARGAEVALAWYEPYRRRPELSVPLWALPFRRPRTLSEVRADGVTLHRVGVRLPELEALRHRPSGSWRTLVAQYDAVLTISGSVLPAGVAAGSGRACLAWVASSFDADRTLRRLGFPALRRLLDRLLDGPLCRRAERRLLATVPLLPLSDYTARSLQEIAPGLRAAALLPWPLAGDLALAPWPAAADGRRRIGFCGRINDPRKNLPLLLDAFAQLRHGRPWLRLALAGDVPVPALRAAIAARGLADAVECHGRLERTALLDFYAALEVFVIPSEQEGLAIVGLEAMARGRPVVATRCGGPEEYVVEGESGQLVAQRADALADAVGRLLESPAATEALGRRAAALVAARYADLPLAARFYTACDRLLGTALAQRASVPC